MIIIASSSPRRHQLLSLAGWSYQSFPANVDESHRPDEDPMDYVQRLAESKARLSLDQNRLKIPNSAFVVAADTCVVFEGEILGKPDSEIHAAEMLGRLRNRLHYVYSGLAVLSRADGCLKSGVCITEVWMRSYSDREIEDYISSGDPMDKAGAYAIQHTQFHPVASWRGCFANVMGLPLCMLKETMQAFGQFADQTAQIVCHGFGQGVCMVPQKLFGEAVGKAPD